MDAFPLTIVLLSTVMHAWWNLMVGRTTSAPFCIWRLQIGTVAVCAVPAIVGLVWLQCLSPKAVLCLIGSGASCGFYLFCLTRGYQSGDFSTVYPASRALPVLMVGLGDVARGHPPNVFGWVGMCLVTAGCLMTPLVSFRDIRLSHYLRPASVWIVLTAMGTVGYSLFDKIGTESIPPGPAQAAVYCWAYYLAGTLAFLPARLRMKPTQEDVAKVGWRIPLVAGGLSFIAYWLVLWAYQMTERASYVVAIRQFSVVLGVLFAIAVLNEPGKKVRLTGAIVITAGLVLLKTLGT